MNWGATKALASSYVHRSDISWDALQPLCCDDINVSLMVQENESFLSLPAMSQDVSSGLWAGPLPDDYVGMRSVRQAGKTLQPVAMKTLLEIGTAQQKHWYAVSGMDLWTVGNADCQIVYTSRVVPCVGDGDTNPVLARYSSIYLYGLLKHCGLQTQDFDAVEKYGGEFVQAVAVVNANYLAGAYGPGMVVLPVGGLV